jgi:hypothetical protein
MTITPKITRGSALRPLDDPETCPRVDQLIGRPLTPVPFSPEAGRPDEADGAPLTKFGWQLRETIARLQGLDPAEVPLGLVRQAEALNANTEENLAGLARPVARINEFGVFWSVPLVVNVPLLMAWIPNGRALRRIAAKIGHEVDVVTSAVDHPTLSLPVMRVHDADQVLDLLETQREMLGLGAYSGDQRDLVDSIASHGVLEPPDVVLTQLVSENGSAWTAQTAEGARRLFAAQLGMITLSNRDVHGLATAHWHGRDAGLRDLGPAELARLEEALTVPDSAAASFFPGRDQATWVETTATRQPAAVAWQLMRTVRINLVLAVEPNDRTRERFEHPVAATIQELIRRYHVNGKAKENWHQADVDGVAAISVIDTFREQGRISVEDRAVWLGRRDLPWDGPLDGAGFQGNRLTSVVRLMAFLTAPGATSSGGVDGVDLVKAVLRDNGVARPGPFERARMAVAQALVPLGQNGSGSENQVAAALSSLFRDGLLWKTAEGHEGGNWTTKLGMPLAALELEARAELAKRPTVKDPVKEFGPAQRALGALGITALIVNPAMLKGGTAVTRTGKGGGGRGGVRLSAADPGRLLDRMLVDPHGIDQLVDAITALVAGRSPGRPADRESNEELSDESLRLEWLKEGGTPSTEENPAAAYIRMVTELVDRGLALQKWEAERLKNATAATIFDSINSDVDDDADPGLFDLAKFYENIGIPVEVADRARDLLHELSEFFADGKANGRAAGRYGR